MIFNTTVSKKAEAETYHLSDSSGDSVSFHVPVDNGDGTYSWEEVTGGADFIPGTWVFFSCRGENVSVYMEQDDIPIEILDVSYGDYLMAMPKGNAYITYE